VLLILNTLPLRNIPSGCHACNVVNSVVFNCSVPVLSAYTGDNWQVLCKPFLELQQKVSNYPAESMFWWYPPKLLCWCQPVKWNDGTNICLCMDQVSPLKTCISPVFSCQIVHEVWFFCSCVFFVDAVYKKHYPPALHDEVWRLDKIGKDGAFHKRLNKAGLWTVEDFLRLVVMDPQRLRNVSSCCTTTLVWTYSDC
jgi:hypothetical protein